MKPYTGYLFDLDGTLIDTAPDISAALNHALTRCGAPAVNEALTRHWVGHGARVLVEQALPITSCRKRSFPPSTKRSLPTTLTTQRSIAGSTRAWSKL